MTDVRPPIAAIALTLACLFAAPQLLAQGEDDPLAPRTVNQRIGGELGFSALWQSGVYEAECGRFETGARITPFIAVAYDYALTRALRFEALLGYRGYGVSSSYTSRELAVIDVVDPDAPDGSSTARVNLDFENVGTANFTTIFLMPSVKLYPTKGFYFGAGANVGLIMGGTSQYTKNILSKAVNVENVGLTEVSFSVKDASDPYSMVYDPQPIKNKSSLGMDLIGYIGAEIPFGRHLRMGPRITYQMPLTPIVTDPELKFSSVTLTLGARWEIE